MAQYMLPDGGVLNEDSTTRTVMLTGGGIVSWEVAAGGTAVPVFYYHLQQQGIA